MLRHAEPAMGTVFSFAVRDAAPADLAPALAELHRLDRIFSTYRPQSDISRLARGELTGAQCDPLVAEALDHCAVVERETDGYFSVYAGGSLDPSGWVKGWAIERASRLLTAAGFPHHSVTGEETSRRRGSRPPDGRGASASPTRRPRANWPPSWRATARSRSPAPARRSAARTSPTRTPGARRSAPSRSP